MYVLGGNGRSESVCQLPQQPTAGGRSEGEEVGDMDEADGDAYDDIGGIMKTTIMGWPSQIPQYTHRRLLKSDV